MKGLKTFKIAFVGDAGVGKTSLIKVFMGARFKGEYKQTIGCDIYSTRKVIWHSILGKIKANIIIWDVAGQPSFSVARCMFYKGSKGALLCFDLTRLESLRNTLKWIEEVLQCIGIVPVVLVGCKSDLIGKGSGISEHEIEETRKKIEEKLGLPVPYIETSAKLNINIDNVFKKLINLIIDSYLRKMRDKI